MASGRVGTHRAHPVTRTELERGPISVHEPRRGGCLGVLLALAIEFSILPLIAAVVVWVR